jgi:endonuclease-3
MTKKERYEFVIDYFQKHLPGAETELDYEDPYELIVAVILSAQCTDKRVNMTTPAIFKKFPDVESLSKTDFDELFPFIKSISYPNNKTRHLIGMAKMVIDKFSGKIPMTVDELIQLPGVGRKTANVITSVVDKQPNMAVDTHVFRVSKRIGLAPANANTPFAVERELVKNFPKELIHKAHHWLILHGRYICVARNPKCEECGVRSACRYFSINKGGLPKDGNKNHLSKKPAN